eukprot:scaffold273983_cov14-Tisochrysis_lutea.AAC.1
MPRFNGGSSMQLAYGATHVCPPNIKGASVAATCRMKDTDGGRQEPGVCCKHHFMQFCGLQRVCYCRPV